MTSTLPPVYTATPEEPIFCYVCHAEKDHGKFVLLKDFPRVYICAACVWTLETSLLAESHDEEERANPALWKERHG